MKNKLFNLFLLVGLVASSVLADTPPPINGFKLHYGSSTGVLKTTSGVPSSLAGSAVNQVLTWNGTGWVAQAPLVNSVTASSPLFSSGGAAPNLTIQNATSLQDGALTSADWTKFNNKTLTSSDYANQGTTSTVLHGNASGNLSFGTVSLTGDVSGVLPVANGGTNKASYSIGSILYASASGVISELLAGIDGAFIRYYSGVPTVQSTTYNPCRELAPLYEDFISNTTSALSTGIGVTGSASGLSRETSLETADHIGVYSSQTGSSSASGASYMGWSTTTHGMQLTNGVATFATSIYLSRLSTAAQEYVLKVGWFDDTTAAENTQNGVYWVYDRANHGDFWVQRIARLGVRTSTPTTIPVQATTWTHLSTETNSAGTSATMKVDGVAGPTPSGTFPSAQMGTMIGIHKSVGIGTNSTVAFDFMYQTKVFATPRCTN